MEPLVTNDRVYEIIPILLKATSYYSSISQPPPFFIDLHSIAVIVIVYHLIEKISFGNPDIINI